MVLASRVDIAVIAVYMLLMVVVGVLLSLIHISEPTRPY